MLHIAVIEDVFKIRQTIIAMIKEQYTDAKIVIETDSIENGVTEIERAQPNVLLLDIDLKDGNAFELLDKLTYKNFQTIFITGNANRGIEAIKRGAIDYIVKPIDPFELYSALNKAKATIKKENLQSTFQMVNINLRGIKSQKRITLNTYNQIYSVLISDIIRCEAEGRYTHFYLITDKKITLATSLKEYDEQLANDGFYRIHQSHLINTIYFDYIQKQPELHVLLTNGDKLPLAEKKKNDFLNFVSSTLI